MRIVAHMVGVDAASALRAGRSGLVTASFARSCYVRFDADWICVGNIDIGPGPLNVPCHADPTLDWRMVAPAGRVARVADDALILDDRRRIVLAHAPVWRAPRCPAWTKMALARGLSRLAELLPPELPSAGLAELLKGERDPRGLVARAAMPAVARLEAWIAYPRGHAPTAQRVASSLVGLGPGLTPSGDDFMAGCLAALRNTARHSRADELWAAIDACGPDATNAISHAHLRAAAKGRLAGDLHVLLNAVLGDNPALLKQGMAKLGTRPNHSPWDGFAGLCTTLRAVAACRESAALE